MIITKLRGENIRQFKELNITFPKKGLMNIDGLNGAGKTTIFLLVELALFGQATDVNSSEIKNIDATSAQKWWLELTFEIDDKEFTVLRHEITAKANLFVNGKELVTGGQTVVTNHIVDKVLKMDRTSFSNAFYARQRDFDKLIKTTPEKRKKEMSRFFGIDKIDRIVKRTREDKNKLGTIIEEKKRNVNDDSIYAEQENIILKEKKDTEIKLKESVDEVQKMENEYKKYQSEKRISDEKYEAFQELKAQLNSKEQEIDYLKDKELLRINNEIKMIEDSKPEFEKLKSDVKKLDEITIKLQELQKEQIRFVKKEQLSAGIEGLESKISVRTKKVEVLKRKISNEDFNKKIEELNKNIIEFEKIVQSFDSVIVEINSSITYLVNEGKRIRLESDKIKELGPESTCPVCKRTMGDHYDHLDSNFEEKLNEMLHQHKDLQVKRNEQMEEKKLVMIKINNARVEIRELELKKQEQQLITKDMDMQLNELASLSEELNKQREEFKTYLNVDFDDTAYKEIIKEQKRLISLRNRYNVLEAAISKEVDYIKERIEIEQKISALSSSIAGFNEQLKSLDFNLTAYKEFQNKVDLLFNNIRTAEQNLSTVESKYKEFDVKLRYVTEERNKNKENKLLLEKQIKEYGSLIKFEEILKGYKIKRMATFRPKIESFMQELLSYITNGKYDLVELDKDYNIFVYRNNNKRPLHTYSGGEQVIIVLCLRLAISRVITSQGNRSYFHYLALDELLSPLDEEKQFSTINALRKLNEIFNQIILITHNSGIKDQFDMTLQVDQMPDLNSKLYWISEVEEE